MKKATLTLLCLFLSIPCYARTITVDADGSGDYPTIQAAIDDANDGDVIIVQPGTYEEDIRFLGKNIILTSINPADHNIVSSTIIGYNGGYLTFCGTEDPNCVLSGFTVNSVIYGMDGQCFPGGEKHTHATITHCVFQGNKETCGTVIYACDGIISNCLIADNNHRFCVCFCPAIDACYGLIRNCTIVNSQWGIEIGVPGAGTVTVENCIIYRKADSIWPQIMVGQQATLNISHTCLQDDLSTVEGTVNWGPGNIIGADPCFIRVGCWDLNRLGTLLQGDYHLQPDSPCINAGDPCYPYDPNETDLDGNPRIIDGRIDMGAYETLTPVEAHLWIMPRTINRKSRQRHIMAWLSLPAGITRDDIDSNVPLTLYPGDIEASRQFIFENKRRDRTNTSILAFFNKQDLMDAVPDNGQVQLEVVGQLVTGRYFFGQRTIRIINPPHRHPNPNYKKDAPTKARSPFD